MKKIFFILIILLIFKLYSNQDSINSTNYFRCDTNFDCPRTGCCYDKKCDKTSKCKKINKICYALVGVAGFVIIALNFLYFWFKIKKTRKVVLELKKIDDKIYSKRKSSNIDLIRKLRNRQSSNV